MKTSPRPQATSFPPPTHRPTAALAVPRRRRRPRLHPLHALLLLSLLAGPACLPARAQVSPQPPRLALTEITADTLAFSWSPNAIPAYLEEADPARQPLAFHPVLVAPEAGPNGPTVRVSRPRSARLYRLQLATSPTLLAGLDLDTGASANDRLTSDPALHGFVLGPTPVTALRVYLDGVAPRDLPNPFDSLGRFTLDRTTLESILGAALLDGDQFIRLEALSATGHALDAVDLAFRLDTTPPRASLSPMDREENVLPRQLIIATFDEPVQIGDLTPDGLRPNLSGSLTLRAGTSTIPGRLVLDDTATRLHLITAADLPGGTQFEITLDGTRVLDLAGNPFALAPRQSTFRTISSLSLPGTAVSGFVYDATPAANGANIPLPGATVVIASNPALRTTTDANGFFLLRAVPPGRLLIDVDGLTVSSPPGTFYPTVAEVIEALPGITNAFPSAIYLPLARQADFVTLHPSQPTPVTNSRDLPGWTLEVPPGAVQRRDGSVAQRILLAPVPPDRLPAPLPPGMDPSIVITIQTEGGADVFTQPVPLTAPNLEGLPPGAKTVLWDFDHARGIFVPVGTATVSADGRTVTTDPGQGVLRPGWHFIRQLIDGVLDYVDAPPPNKSDDAADRFRNARDRVALGVASVIFDVAGFIPGYGILITGIGGTITSSLRDSLANQAATSGALRGTVVTGLSAAGRLSGPDGLPLGDAANATRAKRFQDAGLKLPLGKLSLNVAGKLFSGLSLLSDANNLANDLNDLSQAIKDPPGDIYDQILGAIDRTLDTGNASTDALASSIEAFLSGLESTLAAVRQLEALPPDAPLSPAQFATFSTTANTAIGHFQRASAVVQAPTFEPNGEKYEAALRHLGNLVGHVPEERVYYRLGSGDSPGALQSAAGGQIRVSDRPGFAGSIVVIEPVRGLIGRAPVLFPNILAGVTEVRLGRVVLEPSTAPDTDANGLPDDLDLVMGRPTRAQVELLRSGLPPSPELLDLQGVLARLPNAYSDLAFGDGFLVGIGTNALADLIDIRRPFAPVVIRQLQAPARPLISASTDTARVSARGPRVVLTGRGAYVYDLTDPANPRLLFRDVSEVLGATQANGVLGPNHVVVESQGQLRSYSLASGQVVDSLPLPGTGPVYHLAPIRDLIFIRRFDFVTANLTLIAVRLHPDGSLSLLGSLSPFNWRTGAIDSIGGLAVDDRVLYLGGFQTGINAETNPGFGTFDLSNPAALRLLAPPANNPATGANRLATDGSGHLFASIYATPPGIEVFDVRDPLLTNRRILTLPASSEPAAVASGSGLLAFTGPDGTSLVRAIVARGEGNPPVLESVSLPDGTTVFEGDRLPVHVQISDDSQVTRVELIAQGNNVVAVDTSFPFDLDLPVPPDLPDQQPLTLTVRVTDLAGNTASRVIDLIHRAIAPRLVASSILPGVTTNTALSRLNLTFNQAIDRRSLTNDFFDLRQPGPDGQFLTADDLVLPTALAFDPDNLLLAVTWSTPLAPGRYQARIRADRLIDRGGLSLDGEFHNAFPTGNGSPGGDFLLGFTVQTSTDLPLDAFPHRFFITANPTNSLFGLIDPIAADLDGDGRPDLIHAVQTRDPQLSLLFRSLQNPDGSFAAPVPIELPGRITQLLAGDVSGDSITDLVAVDFDPAAAVGQAPDFVPRRVPVRFSTLVGRGDGTFLPAVTTDSTRLMSVLGSSLLADFNGDGRADLAQLVPDFQNGAEFFNSELLLLPGQPNGALGPLTAIPTPVTPFRNSPGSERTGPMAAADLNQDGHLDLLIDGFRAAAPGLILFGQGNGAFLSVTNPIFAEDSLRLLPGQLTADAFPDVIYGNQVFRGNGDGSFTEIPNAGLASQQVDRFGSGADALVDLDHDGHLDFLAQINFSEALAVFPGSGNGTFASPSRILPGIRLNGFSGPAFLPLSDLNGDGIDEIAFAVRGDSSGTAFDLPHGLGLIFSNPDRSYHSTVQATPVSQLSLNITIPGPILADVTGDGVPDVLAPRFQGGVGFFGLVPGAISGAFGPLTNLIITPGPGVFARSYAAADLNADGFLDLVLSDNNGVFSGTSATFALFGRGQGAFSQGSPIPDISDVLALADLNGDAQPDLVSTQPGSAPALAIRPGRPDGTFAPIVSRIAASAFGANLVVHVADLSGDGRPDLVVGLRNLGTSLLLNNGAATFTVSDLSPAAFAAWELAGVADFTRDGIPDVLLADRTFDRERLVVLPVTTEARFGTPSPTVPLLGSFQTPLVVGDVNGDQIADLVTRGGRGSLVHAALIRLGTGDGSFRDPISLVAAGFGGALALHDFNGDGRPDLLVGESLFLQRPR